MVAAHPTRGLDVGATETVHRTLLEQREQGAAILLISEDLDELQALADRIAVMYEGRDHGHRGRRERRPGRDRPDDGRRDAEALPAGLKPVMRERRMRGYAMLKIEKRLEALRAAALLVPVASLVLALLFGAVILAWRARIPGRPTRRWRSAHLAARTLFPRRSSRRSR